MAPPESPRVFGSPRVRSGLMAFHVWPSLVVRHKCCDEVYSTFESLGENTMGKVHCQRSFRALAGMPEKKRGLIWIYRICPVVRSCFVSSAPWMPAQNIFVFFCLMGMYPLVSPPHACIVISAL